MVCKIFSTCNLLTGKHFQHVTYKENDEHKHILITQNILHSEIINHIPQILSMYINNSYCFSLQNELLILIENLCILPENRDKFVELQLPQQLSDILEFYTDLDSEYIENVKHAMLCITCDVGEKKG